jgi:hypothetical protein
MRRFGMLASTSALLFVLVTTPALAQQPTSEPAAPTASSLGFGVKAGLGLEPDQFVIGLQYSLGKALGIFRIVPNAHLGFGDITTVDLNVDFLARFIAKDSGFGFYGGGAPTFITGSGFDEFGFTLVGGVQVPIVKNKATNIEVRFGLGDLPDIRLLLTLIL